jgi:hypothetical protein
VSCLPDSERVLFIHVWFPLVPFVNQQCVLHLCDNAFCRCEVKPKTRAIVERSRQNPMDSSRCRHHIGHHSRASVYERGRRAAHAKWLDRQRSSVWHECCWRRFCSGRLYIASVCHAHAAQYRYAFALLLYVCR